MRASFRLAIIKKTSRKKIASIIGMISIRARRISRCGSFIAPPAFANGSAATAASCPATAARSRP